MRLQLCLVCREPADTEAPLCKVCVADGASADDRSVTITLGPLTTPAQPTAPTEGTTERDAT